MAVTTKLQPLARNYFVRPGDLLSPAEAAHEVAEIARDGIATALAQDTEILGRPPKVDTFVNGVESSDFEKVKPGGSIVAVFEVGSEAVQYVWDLIIANAPVLTGAFKSSQRILADGVEVASPVDTIGAREVVILSVAPYARKIERGQSQARFPDSAGLYQAAATKAAARFGNVARIAFGFREVTGAATPLDAWARSHGAGVSERRRPKQYARDTRQPAVILSFG